MMPSVTIDAESAAARGLHQAHAPTAAELDRYVRTGRALQAKAMASALRRTIQRLRTALGAIFGAGAGAGTPGSVAGAGR